MHSGDAGRQTLAGSLYQRVYLHRIVSLTFEQLLDFLVVKELVLSESKHHKGAFTGNESATDSEPPLSHLLPGLVQVGLGVLCDSLVLLVQVVKDLLKPLLRGQRPNVAGQRLLLHILIIEDLMDWGWLFVVPFRIIVLHVVVHTLGGLSLALKLRLLEPRGGVGVSVSLGLLIGWTSATVFK